MCCTATFRAWQVVLAHPLGLCTGEKVQRCLFQKMNVLTSCLVVRCGLTSWFRQLCDWGCECCDGDVVVCNGASMVVGLKVEMRGEGFAWCSDADDGGLDLRCW